jgi:hypothetical protein
MADTFTLEGAEMLADKIRRYWSKRGHTVDTWLEKSYDTIAKRTIYFVRSDLVNGMPSAFDWATAFAPRPDLPAGSPLFVR